MPVLQPSPKLIFFPSFSLPTLSSSGWWGGMSCSENVLFKSIPHEVICLFSSKLTFLSKRKIKNSFSFAPKQTSKNAHYGSFLLQIALSSKSKRFVDISHLELEKKNSKSKHTNWNGTLLTYFVLEINLAPMSMCWIPHKQEHTGQFVARWCAKYNSTVIEDGSLCAFFAASQSWHTPQTTEHLESLLASFRLFQGFWRLKKWQNPAGKGRGEKLH